MTELNGVTTEEEGVMRFFQLISVAVIGLTSQVTASVTPSEYYYSVSKSLFEIPDEITTDQGTFSHFSIRCVFGRNYDASELLETLKSKESELYPYLSSIDDAKRVQIARSVKLELGSLSTSYTYESSGDPLFLSGLSEPFFRMDNLRPSPDTRWVSFILSGSVQKKKKTTRALITTHSIPILPLENNHFHIYIESIGVSSETQSPYVLASIYDRHNSLDLYSDFDSLRDLKRKSVVSPYFVSD